MSAIAGQLSAMPANLTVPSGGIEKGEHTVTVSGSEVLADHLGVVGKQGHAVLEFHKSPPTHH